MDRQPKTQKDNRRTEGAIAHHEYEEAGEKNIIHSIHNPGNKPKHQKVQRNPDQKNLKPKTEKFLAFLKIRKQTLKFQMPAKEMLEIPTTILSPSVISEQLTHAHIVTPRKPPKVRTRQIPKIPTAHIMTLKDSEGEHPTTQVLSNPENYT